MRILVLTPLSKLLAKRQYIFVKGKQYTVTEEIFRNPMIEGRATACYFVERDGRTYALKDAWIIKDRHHSEVFFLQLAKEKGITSGIPQLEDWEDVLIGGIIDSCENNRGKWADFPDCVHRRLVFKTCGVPLWHFRTRRELLMAILDCIKSMS